MMNRVFIVGCSRFGAQVANWLTESGCEVVIVDKNEEAFIKLDDHYSGYAIAEEGTNVEGLKELGLEGAQWVIAATESDNTNLMIGLIAKHLFEVPYVLCRLYDDTKESIYYGTGIMSINPSTLTMNQFHKIFLRKEAVV